MEVGVSVLPSGMVQLGKVQLLPLDHVITGIWKKQGVIVFVWPILRVPDMEPRFNVIKIG